MAVIPYRVSWIPLKLRYEGWQLFHIGCPGYLLNYSMRDSRVNGSSMLSLCRFRESCGTLALRFEMGTRGVVFGSALSSSAQRLIMDFYNKLIGGAGVHTLMTTNEHHPS